MRIFVYECVCAGGMGSAAAASLRREGWAMLAAVVADFQRVAGVEVVTLLDEASPPLGDVTIRVNPGDEAEGFRESAGRSDATLVIAPEIDLLLWGRSKQVIDVDGRLLGSAPDAIRLTGDKLATADFWKERGVTHPPTESFDPTAAASFALPWVMKPRYGAGSQATFLVRNHDDQMRVWSPAYHECPDGEFIVQPFIRGQAASVAVLISATQAMPLLPARQHLSRDGRFRYEGGSLPLPEALAERAIALATRAVAGIPGLRGYVGVDLILGEDGIDYAIEINPRLTTSYLGLRQLCEQNLAVLMLRCATGETITPPTWKAGDVQFRI
jgi:predicted ATP-grasp superfamily ATP-dependent carboligase